MADAGYATSHLLGARSSTFDVLGVPISVYSLQETIEIVASWVKDSKKTRLVSFTNVHMITESNRTPEFHRLLCELDLNCPDGMPLVWLGKRRFRGLSRVSGPDFMEQFCAATARKSYRHFFYGGKEEVGEALNQALQKRYPTLQVAGVYSPPFRPLTEEEDAAVIRKINDSGADVVWVCLGCPKQELWMYQHRDKLNAKVALSVGMAFNTVAGLLPRAPSRVRSLGLEWVYRICQDPFRLIPRYLMSNSLFLYLLAMRVTTRMGHTGNLK